MWGRRREEGGREKWLQSCGTNPHPFYSVIHFLCVCVCERERQMCHIRTVMLTFSGGNKSQILLLDSPVGWWLNLFPTQLKRTRCLLIGSFNLPIIRGGESRRAHIPTSCGPRQRHLKCLGVAETFFHQPRRRHHRQ